MQFVNSAARQRMTWNEESMRSPSTIPGRLAEFVACVGIDNLPPGRGDDSGIIPCLDWIQEDDEDEDENNEDDGNE